ncbi:magnesium transporter [Leeuwenhoekiella palythoae]|uniref:Magnesium transporter MgtE n=1 Tax=Leeuwenhoekiella palythoae TaxID=573501 RepID=A0A1M5VG85_9FLAO|nr:magnesium transporter [Leeuwenhoekiella palythoae]MBH12619.1 magnesium transporter [Leeuwenhoekiella sp.]MEC7782118.1 magnesium transporter [Bacteroidota bacterium]MEE3146904.1 magnesium transporter [Bacteroidota bacterium]MEE3243746.1 magnesium transporter [Bacteroidota bacterium]RXG30904.1 Mg2+ transporter MgtE [Leeuwenhoekiella palythoae]|tara:strand:+ start:2475 stop:3827 length:1353 start_codon:yes stop_codon:yes gene_type:complete
MAFELTEDLIEQIENFIEVGDDTSILALLEEVHHADIAEILDEISTEEATYLIKLLDSEKTSEALMELDEGYREEILDNLSPQEIADELNELDTDDAVDFLSELDEDIQRQVIDAIEDEEHARDIIEMLRYDEDSAGGLMAKELVRVRETWTVAGCVRKMRAQAQNVTRVHSVYVVDKNDHLIGRLSLKDLLTAEAKSKISDIYIPNVDSVNVHDTGEDVARIMQKYDLEAVPVVNDAGVLLGRITVDDILDFIRDEADEDYRMAAGISQTVEADDNLFKLTRARLPWLMIGMFGGLGAASIITGFNSIFETFPKLLVFVPLIQATAGNVGVQSSAIVVQGLANDSLKGNIAGRLLKECALAIINGLAIATVVLVISHFFFETTYLESVSIGVAIIAVIILAALIGTFIPIVLDKRGIDPAVATGPFITTSNDVFGILTYFLIAKLILGF